MILGNKQHTLDVAGGITAIDIDHPRETIVERAGLPLAPCFSAARFQWISKIFPVPFCGWWIKNNNFR